MKSEREKEQERVERTRAVANRRPPEPPAKRRPWFARSIWGMPILWFVTISALSSAVLVFVYLSFF